MSAGALRVYGTRYRCVLRYASTAQLDPLAEFMLDVINESEESRSIDRLLKSFGLSRRVMEEILADLVRGNYAWIDLNNGRIVPTGARVQQASDVSENRGVLDIWQDHSTGAIIPLSMITSYKAEDPAAEELPPLPYDQFSGFLEAADAHIISYLVRADPTLRFAEGGDWRLDRLLYRARYGSQAIWVPLRTVPMGTKEVTVVDAPDIPAWMTRSWTATYQRGTLAGVQMITSRSPMPSDMSGSEETPLQHCNLRRHIRRWAESAQEHLNAPRPPQSLQDIRGLDQLQSILQERLLSLAFVEFSSPDDQSHIGAAIRNAQNSVVFVFQRLDSFCVEQICAALGERGDRLDVQVVRSATQGDDGDHQLLAMLAAQGVRNIAVQEISGHFIVVDAYRLTVGDISVLMSRRPALIVRGYDPAAAVLGLVQSRDIAQRDLIWPANLNERKVRNDELSGALFGTHGAKSAATILGELLDFRRQLAMAIQERRLEDRVEPDPMHRDDPESTPDGRARSEGEVGTVPLAISQPDLTFRFSVLSSALEEPLAQGYSAFAYVDGAEQQDALAWASLETPSRRDSITILSSLGSSLEDEVTIEWLRRLIVAGWRIDIVQPQSDDPTGRAATLRKSINTPALRILANENAHTLGALVVNDLLLIGTHQPLGDIWSPTDPATFQLTFYSASIAAALVDLIHTGKEIYPYAMGD